jgi:predicted AlkP superfamily phosphohydrolase/phosphomutase
VFLAFDSPGLELLEEGLADGSLPTVRRLLEQGQYFPIDDHQELLTSPCWLTLIRGCETRYHGQFADRKLIEGTYSVRSIAAEEADRPPFWAHLSDAGLRSTVVSVYGAPIVPSLKGTQVVGWGSNDPINGKVGGARCEPPDVVAQLERIVGPRPPM